MTHELCITAQSDDTTCIKQLVSYMGSTEAILESRKLLQKKQMNNIVRPAIDGVDRQLLFIGAASPN